MKLFKKIGLALLIVFIIIQFIRPAHNTSEQLLSTDIAKIYTVPDSVQHLLNTACYDCHSDNTRYPYYAYIQPVAWFLARHIKHGKADLNFGEFGTYSIRKQQSKLKAIINTIRDDEMPLTSYKLMHAVARLSKEEKDLIMKWATITKHDLQSK
ncbi:MAG: heme-binding domain-containing protein [Ginsengibacter sp.]